MRIRPKRLLWLALSLALLLGLSAYVSYRATARQVETGVDAAVVDITVLNAAGEPVEGATVVVFRDAEGRRDMVDGPFGEELPTLRSDSQGRLRFHQTVALRDGYRRCYLWGVFRIGTPAPQWVLRVSWKDAELHQLEVDYGDLLEPQYTTTETIEVMGQAGREVRLPVVRQTLHVP